MKTIHLKAAIGADGLLRIETPTEYRNTAAEVVLVLHPLPGEATQAYPPDFFERLDAIQSDDLLVRPEQGIAETREPLE